MPSLKFLVVEDDLFYQTYVNDLLVESGAQVINAMDGKAGLAMAVAERPDLIITAIEIPEAHGFALFRNLRQHSETRHIPVIMMAGKVQKPLLERHSRLDVHANGYLVKPFSGQVLIDMIRDVIGEDFGFSEVVFSGSEQDPESQEAAQEAEAAPVIPQSPVHTPAAGKVKGELTVLVVDDSQYICDVARDFLGEMGVRVETAFDGETGYKLASNLLPDVILLDVQMPNLNGFVVCEMLRKQEETKNIPVILMSAVIDEDSFQKHSGLKYHADAYLQKPFMKSELQEIIHRFVSVNDQPPEDVESKTGFFIPTEGADNIEGAVPEGSQTSDTGHFDELETIRSELSQKVLREEKLEMDLESSRSERDRLESELFDLRKAVDDRESALRDKLTLLTQRYDEARETSEKLAEENRVLGSRLEEESAHLERSQDLEKELQKERDDFAILKKENEDLRKRVQDAESAGPRVHVEELDARLAESDSLARDLEKRNELLTAELEELRSGSVSGNGGGSEDGDRQTLLDEIQSLRRDLDAAVAAKREIEDQAQMMLEKRNQRDEAPALEGKLAEALETIEVLKKGREEQTASVEEVDQWRLRCLELEKINEDLKKEGEKNNELAAGETRTRIDLEGRIADLTEKKSLLEDELNTARSRIEELEGLNERIRGLESRIEAETELRALSDKKVRALREQLEISTAGVEDVRELKEDSRKLREELKLARKRNDDLEREIERFGSGRANRDAAEATGAIHLEERLDQLEAALNRTVLEAQNILKEQQDRESTLEGNVESLMRSLEEERLTYRKDREVWATREVELKDAFEEAIRESRRLANEGPGRFYPMQVPRLTRPVEVVPRKSRLVYGAVAAAAALLLFAGGYFVPSIFRSRPHQPPLAAQNQPASEEQERSADQPFSAPWIAIPGTGVDYEELWRMNTVQSVSDDMLIQATLHTREELAAAIYYSAEKEDWSGERMQKALADLPKTYNLSDSYYITVYTRNLKNGYPGYADNLERHIALRDQSGREAKAYVPAELERSKFITSRVSSAGKDMNEDSPYLVGLTVAFPKGELAAEPKVLQLVLYDIGAVPVRILAWDMSRIGSLSD